MLIELAIIVIIGSIVVLFAKEFGAYIMSSFEIPGVALLLPLTVISWVVCYFEYWVLWGVYLLKSKVFSLVAFLVSIMPFQMGSVDVAGVIFLMVCSVLPVAIINLYCLKKMYKPFQYPYLISMIVWIICAMLLVC